MSKHIHVLPRTRSASNGNGSNDSPITTADEGVVQALLEKERTRLTKELQLVRPGLHHAARPVQRPFVKSERPFTTILFGGLTWKHERLIEAMMTGLGYKAARLPTPDVRAFQIGKEYGNNGQCNPTYFTVGNLVQYLQQLEEQGLTRREIVDSYVFFTAGACGPCRFGMYEAEYRSSLRNAGFDGFRVLILEQTGGLDQAQVQAGLEMNLDFTLGILNALNLGDILNDVAYRIRPFEVEPGTTDRALNGAIEIMAAVLADRGNFELQDTRSGLRRLLASRGSLSSLSKFGIQVFGEGIMNGLRECRALFDQVRIDPLRVRPVVKITGEFWAQTTEGDGNFNMFRFLEQEGAQVLIEPIATWLMYMLHQIKQELADQKRVGVHPDRKDIGSVRARLGKRKAYARKWALFTLSEYLFQREYNRMRRIFNDLPGALPDQYELQRIAHPYYNTRVEGGEGHLEVAKNIYYMNKRLCHMVLSLKPFGCMPSTQSDGVQSAVMSHYKDILFLPIETSGEGEINAHSRVQMVLGEARYKAKAEFHSVLEKHGLTADEIGDYIRIHQAYSSPFYRIADEKSETVGLAARTAEHVASRLRREA
jgi:predicted nucleotide-binding protein (sugar kinase/HSP70/actin superfamily)